MIEKQLEKVVLGGGCFWCLEAAYSECRGVVGVVSGYSGGRTADPYYEAVCAGITGHAEVVEVEFDTKLISFEQILSIFFSLHDPTSLNRQGNDIGEQYRSVIFYNSEAQKKTTETVMKELEEEQVFSKKIVTQLLPLEKFYPAEEYHQKYFQKNPNEAYCQVMIDPKLQKIRAKYGDFFAQ